MNRFVDRLLNWGWQPEQHSIIQMRRIRTLSGSALLLVLVGIPFWLRAIEWQIAIRMVTVPTAIGLTVIGLVLLRWRHTARMHFMATHLFSVALYIAGLGALLSGGGLGTITQGWLLLVPVVAGINLGLRAALLWGVIILTSLIVVAVLGNLGYTFPDLTPHSHQAAQHLLQALGVFVALMILVSSFISQMSQSEALLAQQNLQLQQQIAEKEKAEREARAAEQAKTRFLANMSHEMRTPLNAILGFSRRLDKSLGGRLDGREREALQRIAECGGGMLRLVEDLFALSAIDAGTLSLQSQPVPLAPLLERVIAVLQPLAQERSLQLLQGHCPSCAVVADPDRLEQVLASLLRYSLTSTAVGSVQVSTRLQADQQVCVEIEDSATSLAESERLRLLDRYNHLHSMCGEDLDGYALGPALAGELVRLQGGAIQIGPGTQGGNCFRIWLPLHA